MVTKVVWAALIAVGVLSVSGMGFAAFISTATITGTGTAGNINLAFENLNTNLLTNTPTYSSCTGAVNSPANTATVVGTNFGPEAMCVIYANLTNTGSLPVTSIATKLVWTSNVTVGGLPCWHGGTLTATASSLAPGATTMWEGFFEVEGSTECQLSVGSLTATFTGTLSNANSLSDSP